MKTRLISIFLAICLFGQAAEIVDGKIICKDEEYTNLENSRDGTLNDLYKLPLLKTRGIDAFYKCADLLMVGKPTEFLKEIEKIKGKIRCGEMVYWATEHSILENDKTVAKYFDSFTEKLCELAVVNDGEKDEAVLSVINWLYVGVGVGSSSIEDFKRNFYLDGKLGGLWREIEKAEDVAGLRRSKSLKK